MATKYMLYGNFVIELVKTEHTICNEMRKNINEKNRIHSLYRGTEFIIKSISLKVKNDVFIFINLILYYGRVYSVGTVIKAPNFDFNLENEDTDGLKYYLNYDDAFMSSEKNILKYSYTGFHTTYYSNGNVKCIIEYKDGLRCNTYVEFYNCEKELVKKGYMYLLGKKNGICCDYRKDGSLKHKRLYFNDNLIYVHKFFKDGKIKSKISYCDKKKDGEYKKYYKNGCIKVKGYYFAGNKDELWTYGTCVGTIRKKGKYEKGKMAGYWVEYINDHLHGCGEYFENHANWEEYYADGKTLHWKGEKKRNERIGRWIEYDISGNIKQEKRYRY